MDAVSGPGVASPFEHLRISLDSRTLGPSRRVKSIEQDGSFAYEEERTADDELTETLTRIWNEIPEGLLDLTEERLEMKALDEPVVEPEEEDNNVESKDPSGMMQWDDMVKLREGVGMQLNNARNELWFALELAKTLAVSSSFPSNPPFVPEPNGIGKKTRSKKEEAPPVVSGVEAPVFPPGTFSTTPFRRALPSHAQVIHDMELALAAKQSVLEECERMIDTAVEEFNKQSDASRRFWRDIRELKDGREGRGQWAVVPKPDFGKILAAGETTRDVVIPYAVDEASASTRSRCLAAFDLDPSKETLTFGSRSRRTLRISTGPSTLSGLASTAATDNLLEMQNAQIEAFDEELYIEIRDDVSRRPGGSVDADGAKLVVEDQTILFEMISSEGVASEGEAAANLMLQTCRLSLLNVLKQRKRRLTSANWTRPASVLSPLLQICHFAELYRTAEAMLQTFARTLSRAGVSAKAVRRSDLMESTDLVRGLLQGEQDYSALGAVLTLDVAGCVGVSINLSATSVPTVTTSRATFVSANMSDAAPMIAEDVTIQLMRWAVEVIQDKVEARHVVFFDELDGHVATPLGNIRLSLDAPYGALGAEVEGSRLEALADGSSVVEWLDGVVALVG